MGKLKTLTAFLVGIVLVTVGFALNTFSATTPPQASDGYYELDSYEDLVWFQQYIDAGNLEINARLTADIVANENLLNDKGSLNGTPSNTWTPIGRNFTLAAKSYNGTLDGAGHSITGLFFYDTKGAGYYGLFAKMGRGTVKNLAIVDSYFGGVPKSNYVGTFVGEGYAVNVENCYSNAIIYASDYYGGIVGKTSVANIRNCLYAGTFRILGSSIYADPIVKKNSTDNSIRVYDCYYKGDCGLTSSTVATAVATNGLASGQVTYLLNRNQSSAVWRQNIDIGEKDSEPTLDTNHHIVFYNGNKYTNYCNVHSWSDGICSVCGLKCTHNWNDGVCSICGLVCTHGKYKNGICTYCEYGVEEPQLVGEYYEIGNYGNLIWFQRYVDAGNVNINAKLTSDIVANENLLDSSGNVQGTPKYNWTPIGRVYSNSSDSYNGIFDGAGYSISGLYSNGTENYCGFFGKMNKGTIKNLSIVDSYFGKSSCYFVGSFVGYGHSYSNIENCYSNATIVGWYYCGGIAGETKGTVSNCLYNGKIKGTMNSNAIASDRYNEGTITNCYYNENCGLSSSRATSVTDDQLSSGEVAYLLNGDQSDIKWYQNIDKGEKDNVPTLNIEHYTVYKNNNGYTNILLGDVNDDGKVDRKDAVLILKNISGIALDKFSTENADYNGDGVINSLDVIAIMKSI